MRNVPCVTYLGAENLCPAESARGNITSDEMTMIKISFSPAPSRARRRPGRRVAGRRGAGGWAAEGAGAWAHRSREGPGGGPGGKARTPGEAGGDRPAEGRETARFCRQARQARARGANCDSNPLPRGAAEPRARSRRALPLALAALGNLEPDRCPLRPGSAATGRGLRAKVGGWLSRQQSGKAAGERGGRRGGGSGGRAAGERREEEAAAAAARRGGGEGRAGRGGPGAPRREGPREAGAGAGGVGGGRVGGERESNSRTRPERPAQQAEAARLRPAPETSGCAGRGLRPSPIRRSGSEVSLARAATAQRRAPLSLKWLRYPESRPAVIRTWEGRLLCPGAERRGLAARGHPAQRPGAGGEDCPRGPALAPGGPSPRGRAPSFLPHGEVGVRGCSRPGTRASVPGRAPCRAGVFPGSEPGSRSWGFG